MDDNKTVFEDIMAGLSEIEEHQKCNIKLRSHTVETPDDEIERNQLLWHKITDLSEPKKQKVIQYVDELLQA